MNIRPRVWFIVSAAFAVLASFGYIVLQRGQEGDVGFDTHATYSALDDAAQALGQADKKGDVAVPTAMFDVVTPMVRKINEGSQTIPATNHCQLAAAHLINGVLSVASGGTWQAKRQFEAALSYCK